MNLVEVGERTVFLRQIANRRDRTEIGIHRIDGFERDQLWKFWVGAAKQLFKVRDVVVTEEVFFRATVTNSLDHRGVIERVRVHNQSRKQFGECRQRRFIRDEARREDESGFLAVEIRELALELHVIVGGPRNVSRAAGACSGRIDGFMHGGQHLRVLSHAEIIVAAPDRDGRFAPSPWKSAFG